jgi:hypothetical protein
MSASVIWNNCYEMWFSADDSVLGFPEGLVKGHASNSLGWVCSRKDCLGTDDDLGVMSGSAAISVFNALFAIIEDFIKTKRPSGIIIGSKSGAKGSRSAIYKRMGKMAAQKFGGQYYDLDQYRTPQAREGLMHGVFVTLGVRPKTFLLHHHKSK